MNQIKAGAVLNYVIIGINTLLGLLYTPYMLGKLGQSEFGLYSLVSSIIAYLTILDFGFGNAIIRYTAKFKAMQQQSAQWEMFGMFLIVYSLIGLLALGIGSVLYFNIDLLFDRTMTAGEISQAKVMIILLLVNLALTFPLSMFGSIIMAYEKFVFQKLVNIARILISTAVIVILLFYGYKAVALVVVQTVFNIGCLLLNVFYCIYRLRIKVWFKKFDFSFFKEISIYSFWVFLYGIMDRVYWSTGQFVLGSIVGTVAVAVFSVAVLLQQMYLSFSSAVSSVLLPRITTMVATNHSKEEISDIFIRTGRLQFIVIGLILAGFILFGKAFINLWAGPNYDESYYITLIFFVALLTPLIQNTGTTILEARNQLKFRSLLYLAVSMLSLGCQIWLAHIFGPIGCAIGIGGALLIGQGLIMNIYYYKKQQIDIIKFWREIGKMAVAPVCLSVIAFFLIKYIPVYSWSQLCIVIFAFIACYAPLCWLFSMNAYERSMAKSLLLRGKKLFCK